MSEPSSAVPHETSDDDVPVGADSAPTTEPDAPESVELDVDEEKVGAWDEVKGDYQAEPDGHEVPNSMDTQG